jgi:3D (Asp-Asp-Asp) domain-containing protein
MYNRLATLLIAVMLLKVTVTAYHAPCRLCHTKRHTITGANATRPGIAVDPRLIPLGSKVKVNGRWYVADDVGPKGRHVDIRFRNRKGAHKAIKAFGRRHMVVKVKLRRRRR